MKTPLFVRKMNLALLGCLLTLNLASQTQNIAWALNSYTFGNYSKGLGLAVDQNNNVYTSGYFQFETVYGSNTLSTLSPTLSTYDIFMCKVSPNGIPLTSQRFGDTYDDMAYDIFIDGSGNQYLGGSYNSTMSFGSYTLIGQTPVASEAFLCKLDPTGNVLWAKQHFSTSWCFVFKVVVNGAGDIYTFGSYMNSTSAGSTTLTSNGSADIFVAKYSSAGNLLWLKGMGGPQFDYPGAMAIDASGNIYISGTFESTASIGQSTLVSSGSSDGFVAKIDPNGNSVWVKKIGGSGTDLVPDLTIDNAGYIYSVGKFSNLCYFDNTPLIAFGAADAFVARFDPQGNLTWVRKFSPTSSVSEWVSASDVAVDKYGGIYLAGELSGSAQFGPGSVQSPTLNSINGGSFILKLDPNGYFLWVKQLSGGSGAPNYFENVVASPNGDIYAQVRVYLMGQIENYVLPVNGMCLLKLVADPSVGMDEQQHANFAIVYPNPTQNFVEIKSGQATGLAGYTLYDSFGKMLEKVESTNDQHHIDLRALEPGIYYLEITTEKGIRTKKIIKN